VCNYRLNIPLALRRQERYLRNALHAIDLNRFTGWCECRLDCH